MKQILFILTGLILSCQLFAEKHEVNGYFQGENLYVLNSFASDGDGFCITEITVNGQKVTDQINSSSFELNLTKFQLNKGDSISIVFSHKDDCKPQILNLDVLKPKSTFTITNIEVTPEGVLEWSTIEENGKLPFIIETYKWGKWYEIGKVEGIGSPSAHNYKYKVNSHSFYKPHSGINRYRVKQIDYKNRERFSLEAKYKPKDITEVTIVSDSKKIGKEIQFSAQTCYQVYDKTGNLKAQGYGISIDMSRVEKGKVFLNYDNKSEKLSK